VAGLRILVLAEFGGVPQALRACNPNAIHARPTRFTRGRGEDGVGKGIRTPDLRYHKPAL
jgi:hypothetical protein